MKKHELGLSLSEDVIFTLREESFYDSVIESDPRLFSSSSTDFIERNHYVWSIYQDLKDIVNEKT